MNHRSRRSGTNVYHVAHLSTFLLETVFPSKTVLLWYLPIHGCGGETRTPNTVLLIIKVMSLACYHYITPRYKLGLFYSCAPAERRVSVENPRQWPILDIRYTLGTRANLTQPRMATALVLRCCSSDVPYSFLFLSCLAIPLRVHIFNAAKIYTLFEKQKG